MYELEHDTGSLESEYARPQTERAVRVFLATADSKNARRMQWPNRLRIFPFTVPIVQRVALRALGYLFRDQRHVNDALIQATRALLAANEALQARVAALEAGTPDARDPD